MKKILFLIFFATLFSAQEKVLIDLNESIKDKTSRTKSLKIIDRRKTAEVGSVTFKKGSSTIGLPEDNVSAYLEKRFEKDNKTKGNNDIVLLLEDLSVYNEQSPNDVMNFVKAKIRVSSFLKRNDKYYFIDRFDNVIVQPVTNAKAGRAIASNISDALTQFIKNSYAGLVTRHYIPESELENYESYLSKYNKALTEPALQDGVYFNYKSFFEQTPDKNHSLVKSKKGEVKKIVNKQDLAIPMHQIYSYVDNGDQYIFTVPEFKKVLKDENGYYIMASRAIIFPENPGTGAIVGAVAGGMVGAAIGAAIDSSSTRGAQIGYGFKSGTMTKAYIDPLTGDFTFKD